MNPVEHDIRNFLADNFFLGAAAQTLAGDESLTQSGVVDSMGVSELIFFVEENFEITVDDADVVPENLDSIDSLTRFVESKRVPANAG